MKKFLAFLIIFAFNTYAAESDPSNFNEGICSGPNMTDERALELLGSNSTANLAFKAGVPFVNGYTRIRQKLGGKTGKWSLPNQVYFPLTPSIVNSKGLLAADFHVLSAGQVVRLQCEFRAQDSFSCSYKGNDETMNLNWGNQTFSGNLTNNCLWLKSVVNLPESDQEWVYYLTF